jgi:hypothetical protein
VPWWEGAVLGVDKGTAEEFHGRLLSTALVLERAARQHAIEGDVVEALADAWGADVMVVQAVIWERILVASASPQRQFFRVAEAVTAALLSAGPAPTGSAAEVIVAARLGMSHAFDASLAADVRSRLPDISYLAGLPAPTEADVREAADARLQGMPVGEFVDKRRAAAAAAMLQAHEARVRGDVDSAIQFAYESDFLCLEAYLVESAAATADVTLQTVTVRWDIAVQAVTEITGLPQDFVLAVGIIRDVLATALGDADGSRLRGRLAPA